MAVLARWIGKAGLRWRVLIPLVFGFVLLILMFAAAFFALERIQLDDSLERDLHAIAADYHNSLALRGEKLAAVAVVLAQEPGLRAALLSGDRQALLTYAITRLEQLQKDFKVTHLHFLDAGRRVLLRSHDPGLSGNQINRFTAHQAERTGRYAVGVELGRTSSYTMRAVVPVKEGGRIIGYIELGEEILDSLLDLSALFKVDGFVLLNKAYLDRDAWERFMETLGRQHDWDRFMDVVLVAQTRPDVPKFLPPMMTTWEGAIRQKEITVEAGKQVYNVGFLPLPDVEGRRVGHLVVLRDVTALNRQAITRLSWSVAGALLMGVALSLLFYLQLRRMERDLEEAHARVVAAGQTREEEQRRHIAELGGYIDELERFERLSFGRELRMKELTEEITALRSPSPAEFAGNLAVTAGSGEALPGAETQLATDRLTEEGQRRALLFMLEDLEAARKKIERAHLEWMAALDVVDDPIFLHDREFRILRCNKAYQQRAGLPFEQIIGQPYYDIFPKADAPLPCCRRAMEKAEEEEEVSVGEILYRSRSFSVKDEQGDYLHSVHIFEDITKSHHAEAELRESEERFRAIFEGTLDGILLANAETRQFSISNPTMCRMLGYSPAEIMKLGVSDIHPQQDLPHVIEQFERQLHGEIELAADIPVKRKDGSVFYADIKSAPVNFSGKTYLLGMFRDITERKGAEESLQRINRALRVLSAGNRAVVQSRSEQELLRKVCQVVVKEGGYRMAWVGYAEHDENKTVWPMAHAGAEDGYLKKTTISWSENDWGRGPTGTAIRTGKTSFIEDIATDPGFSIWCKQAQAHGYASIITLPLQLNEKAFGALNIYSGKPARFNRDEVELLEEMAGDLAYGIVALRTRAERDCHEQALMESRASLRVALIGSISVASKAVEARDPYTAGHQQRVARLSAAMARELGWPEDRVEGLRLGAMIHDIGKINIPADILSKPGLLSSLEFALVQSHAVTGYEILKDISFPWPVADIAHQHHERLDGSGYPQGLKGDQICAEAKIVAVADVVEAMSSYRPYRPALSMEAALAEIESGMGSRYDEEVADACIRLIREKGVVFLD